MNWADFALLFLQTFISNYKFGEMKKVGKKEVYTPIAIDGNDISDDVVGSEDAARQGYFFGCDDPSTMVNTLVCMDARDALPFSFFQNSLEMKAVSSTKLQRLQLRRDTNADCDCLVECLSGTFEEI